MNDEQEGAHAECSCRQAGRAAAEDLFAEDDFTRDDSAEDAKKRNFVLISGGPGLYDTRDVEHDISWANYVTPPLLMSPLNSSGKLTKQFWESDEDVWWLVYKPAYVTRWADDEQKGRSSVKEVKGKGFTSYVNLIEKRAADRGWNLRWLSKADDLWSKLKSFKNPVSRVWYWGHARNDLWLSVGHNVAGGATAPSADAIIEITDIDACVRKVFQKGDKSRVHRFVGCNTRLFAKAWALAYDVWVEGVDGKVSFVSLSATGGEPCLVKTGSVHYFKPCGATAGAPASPYKTCKSLNLGEGLDFETDAGTEGEYVTAAAGEAEDAYAVYAGESSSPYESAESDYEAAESDYESDESTYESAYEADDESELSPPFTTYEPSLVELADAAVAGGGSFAPGQVLSEMLDPQVYGAALNPLGTGRALSPAAIYDAFANAGSTALRQHFESIFEVVAAPRQSFEDRLRPGDLLLRRGEGGLGHLAVIAAPNVWHLEQLDAAGLRPEGARAGLYAHVIEGGAFPHTAADGFARLVLETTGRVPPGQMFLRLRRAPAASGWESDESRADSSASAGEAGTVAGPAFPANAVIDERIDVSAQFALQRMSRGDPSAREDAVGMLGAVKGGELQGIFGDDLRKAAELAARRGTVRWELVPKGEDAALVLEPGDTTGAVPPTIIFRGGNPPQNQGIRNQPHRLDPALRKAWHSFLLLKRGEVVPCPLPGPDEPTVFGASAEDVLPPILGNVVPLFCQSPGKPPKKAPPPVKPKPCAITPQAASDPSALTVSPVGKLDYSVGSTITTTSGKTLHLRGTVRYPAKTAGTSKPFNDGVAVEAPIVFMAHGQHAVVHKAGDRSREVREPLTGPLPGPGNVTIDNHNGYTYFQDALARMGIISVSIDCNETGGARNEFQTPENINDRADLIAATIKHFQAVNSGSVPSSAPESLLKGHIDFDNVGLLGHSRGGEAVLVVPSLPGTRAVSGVKFKGIISLAPTDTGIPGLKLSGFGLLVILPAADGDVDTSDGAKFYDRAQPSPCKTQLYVEDTNHNFYNTEWVNDEGHKGPGLLSKPEHKDLLRVYGCAFFRAKLLGHAVEKILTGQETPPGARADKVQVSAELASSLTVDNHQDADATTNTLKQKITQFGYGPAADERLFSQSSGATPNTFYGATRGLVLQRKSAKDPNQYTSPLDKVRNLRGREIWVRAAEVHNVGGLPTGATGFKLALIDKKNHMVFIDSDETGGVPRPYNRGSAPADHTKTMLKTFRFPASCFKAPDFKIDEVKAVALHLDRVDGRMLAFDQLQIV